MQEKPKRKHADTDYPCHICGGERFTWGKVIDSHPGGRVHFRADGEMWGGGTLLRARRCSNCGNVQFFA